MNGAADLLAVVLGLVAICGQLFNYVLHLRVRAAILESEQKMFDKVDEDFVRKETCQAEMRYQELRRIRQQLEPED